jgi:hypothetical protein
LAYNDFIDNDIINYYGFGYGSNHGGLKAMFVDSKYL